MQNTLCSVDFLAIFLNWLSLDVTCWSFQLLKNPEHLGRKVLPAADVQPYIYNLFQLGEGLRYERYEKHWFLHNTERSDHSNKKSAVIFKNNPTPSPQKAVEEKCSVLALELHAFLRQYQSNIMLPAQ